MDRRRQVVKSARFVPVVLFLLLAATPSWAHLFCAADTKSTLGEGVDPRLLTGKELLDYRRAERLWNAARRLARTRI
jgi:hypothetical protein